MCHEEISFFGSSEVKKEKWSAARGREGLVASKAVAVAQDRVVDGLAKRGASM